MKNHLYVIGFMLLAMPWISLADSLNIRMDPPGKPEAPPLQYIKVPQTAKPDFMSAIRPAEPRLYSPQENKLLLEELLMAYDGATYTYSVYKFLERETAENCLREGFLYCREWQRGKIEETRRAMEIPIEIRHTLASLSPEVDEAVVYLPKDKYWAVVTRDDSSTEFESPDEFLDRVNLPKWLAFYAPTVLPDLKTLQNNPARDKRYAMFGLKDLKALDALNAKYRFSAEDFNMEFPNGDTPLIRALFRGDLPLATQLLNMGASVNKCTYRWCPLTVAVLSANPAMVTLLLDKGADPEMKSNPERDVRTLSHAVGTNTEMLKLLLDRGVRPDIPEEPGTPSKIMTPLMLAVAMGKPDAVQLLMDAGADPLRLMDAPHLEKFQVKQGLMYFLTGSDPEFAKVIGRIYDNALAKTGKYEWDVWLEQDGHRVSVKPGQPVTLLRKPFQVRMSMADAHTVWAAASVDPALTRLPDNRELLISAMSPLRAGAVSADSSYLSLQKLTVRETSEGREFSHDFAFMTWGFDPEFLNGTHELPSNGPSRLFTRDVTELINDHAPTPIADYKGPDIYLLMGVQALGRGAHLYKPQSLQLHFIDPPPAVQAKPAAVRKPKKSTVKKNSGV